MSRFIRENIKKIHYIYIILNIFIIWLIYFIYNFLYNFIVDLEDILFIFLPINIIIFLFSIFFISKVFIYKNIESNLSIFKCVIFSFILNLIIYLFVHKNIIKFNTISLNVTYDIFLAICLTTFIFINYDFFKNKSINKYILNIINFLYLNQFIFFQLVNASYFPDDSNKLVIQTFTYLFIISIIEFIIIIFVYSYKKSKLKAINNKNSLIEN